MIVARLLADLLAQAGWAGRLQGHVIVVPFANPLGLGQVLHGDQSGRFDLYGGRNFNRDYPGLTGDAADRLTGARTDDPQRIIGLVRAALRASLNMRQPVGPSESLRYHLMGLALDADVVLDLHRDGEAEIHPYTQPCGLGPFRALGRADRLPRSAAGRGLRRESLRRGPVGFLDGPG